MFDAYRISLNKRRGAYSKQYGNFFYGISINYMLGTYVKFLVFDTIIYYILWQSWNVTKALNPIGK